MLLTRPMPGEPPARRATLATRRNEPTSRTGTGARSPERSDASRTVGDDMAVGGQRGPRRGARLRWMVLLAGLAAIVLAAGVRFRHARAVHPERSRGGLQTPTFHVSSSADFSHSPAAQRLRAGAAGANAIIILLDAACADHFTSSGYSRNTTPNIAKFQANSVLFTEAYSAAASTKPSVASLFTAQFPDTHGALALPSRLGPEGATLAECLRGAGYTTAAFSASPSLSASFGYNRGFGYFREIFREAGLEPATAHRRSTGALPVDGALVVGAVVDWVRAHKSERFFAYIHFREPHYPYIVPPSFRAPFLDPKTGRRPQKILYDASLAYVDSLVGKLLADLDAQGLLDRSVVVLLADHGEAFGEHGRVGHSSTPYIEMTHVPLTIHLPSRCGVVPQRRPEIFCLTDLMPTLLDLLRIAPPKTMQGRTRLVLLAGEKESAPAFAVSRALGEDHTGGKIDYGQVSYALRVPRYTLVLADQGQRVELYDRGVDPGELHDIVAEKPDEVKKLRAQFEDWAASQRGRPVVLPGGQVFSVGGDEAAFDEATRRQLKALGYLR